MITSRRTRLVRVPDLHDFRRAVTRLAAGFAGPGRQTAAVILPTQAAAVQLRRTLARQAGLAPEDAPLLLTRDQLYDALHARLDDAPRRLGAFERDAMAQGAALDAAGEVGDLPFSIRPGLVAEVLRFYDHLRRQSQEVKRFEDLMVDALGGGGIDRGAERLLQQTRFLVRTFHAYEQRVRESGACDEHGLRQRLLEASTPRALRHVVVTVPDWIADPAGLFVADFELLARIPGLETLDIVSTASTLGSGFHERIHQWWPGLEEIEGAAFLGATPRVRPLLVRPAVDSTDRLWFTRRDREEELAAIARRLRASGSDGSAWDRTAVVFRKPLPYLYIAPDTFGAAGIPYRTTDALPLAVEPMVAVVDLLLDAVQTRFARGALVALLGSPHLRFEAAGVRVDRASIGELNRALSDARYLGGFDHLAALAERHRASIAAPAFQAGLSAAAELAALAEPAPASSHIDRFTAFLERHLRQLHEPSDAPLGEPHGKPLAQPSNAPRDDRERRAHAAVSDLLRRLAAAHRAHHDPDWTIDDLASALRRWIGEDTFAAVQPPDAGVHLVDDQAARYGEFDDITIVGLIDGEWPERSRRNIFYPPALLKALNWPSEKDRRTAEDARFIDLLASASVRVSLSTLTLDDEAFVMRSVQLDEISRAGLSVVPEELSVVPEDEPVAVAFPDEGLTADPPRLDTLAADTSRWAAMRVHRSPAQAPQFHGATGSRGEQPWAVSALETYLACPFKFFAQHVLRLEDEPDDEEVMDPRRQGRFLHEVFETFFREWQGAGHREIVASNLHTARALFTAVVDRMVGQLPEGEAALERTRLLGSPAAAGLGEAVFRMEAERPVPVVERLLEHPLKGRFSMATSEGPRQVELRGKADRLDLLADGTFRVIDYKLGWPPDRSRALQLPIYSVCAEQQLDGHRGRRWTVGEAVYLAFKGPRRVVPLFTSPANRQDMLAHAQQRLADALDAIGRGDFPPSPDDVYRCDSCSYAAVCRKDYVGDV